MKASDDKLGLIDRSQQRIDAAITTLFMTALNRLFLGLEVQVQQPLADPGTLRDFLDARPGIAFFRKHLEGRLRYFPGPLLLAPLKARFGHPASLADS